MAKIDTSRRQQLAARLKSAVATAAVVGTLGGWIAFGTQEPATTADVTTTATPTAAAVAQASTNNDATSAVVQPDLSSDTPPTIDVAPSTEPTATSAPTATSVPAPQPAPVTRTRSSR